MRSGSKIVLAGTLVIFSQVIITPTLPSPVKGEGILALLNLPPPLAGGVGGGG
jgi:hypothetical protein